MLPPVIRGRRRTAALLLALFALGGCASGSAGTLAPTSATPGTSSPGVATSLRPGGADHAELAPTEPTTDLPTMSVSQLPPEGVDTLELIEAGGPFPYEQDGATFQNREGILPRQPRGFYAEYTVVTPGEDDRGARRIVAGDDGSRFYTADHYGSFREVVSG